MTEVESMTEDKQLNFFDDVCVMIMIWLRRRTQVIIIRDH